MVRRGSEGLQARSGFRLSALGFRLWDFGSGISSLACVRFDAFDLFPDESLGDFEHDVSNRTVTDPFDDATGYLVDDVLGDRARSFRHRRAMALLGGQERGKGLCERRGRRGCRGR